jgi:hypothetical protein
VAEVGEDVHPQRKRSLSRVDTKGGARRNKQLVQRKEDPGKVRDEEEEDDAHEDDGQVVLEAAPVSVVRRLALHGARRRALGGGCGAAARNDGAGRVARTLRRGGGCSKQEGRRWRRWRLDSHGLGGRRSPVLLVSLVSIAGRAIVLSDQGHRHSLVVAAAAARGSRRAASTTADLKKKSCSLNIYDIWKRQQKQLMTLLVFICSYPARMFGESESRLSGECKCKIIFQIPSHSER